MELARSSSIHVAFVTTGSDIANYWVGVAMVRVQLLGGSGHGKGVQCCNYWVGVAMLRLQLLGGSGHGKESLLINYS